MRFPDRFLEDIRDRLRISEVVGQRVQFDKKKTNAAKGDYWACCPFHGEKSPSFHCEDRKGRYYCFGCGASGDHFRFLTELDGLNFHEAVEVLAGQAGLPMPVLDKREQEKEEKRKSLYDVMDLAAQFFQNQLHEPSGANARAYLRNRGLSPSTQKEFGIGFSPNNRNALKQFLSSKGVEANQMEACGLVVHGEGIAVSYDRFRDRIMFPIEDSRGRVIAFGGRAMNPDAKAKYLNSPETELFKKSNVLYNFKRARNHIHTSNEVIVAEGYMDVIALHAAGFRNAVAPLGTALTDSHLDTLWKVCEKPTLCFDGDSAGQRAASRAVELALPKIHDGKTLRFLGLPDGMDPDDFLKEFGSNKFKQIFNGAIPLHEMILERRLDSVVLDTPEQKAKFEKDVMADVALIKDPAVLKYYRSHQRMRLYELFGTLRNSNRQQDNNRRAAISKEIASIPQNSLVRMLLGLCVEYPGVVQEFIEEIVNISFDNNVYHTFVGQLYKLYVEYENLNVATIYEKLDDDLRFVLESVHGEASTSTTMIKNGQERFEHFTKRGHKLRLLFPAIKVEPPASTIRDFVIMVIEQLHHRIAKNELEIIKQSPDMNPESIYELAMSLQEQEARLSKIEREIDEQFQSLRRTGLDAMYVAA